MSARRRQVQDSSVRSQSKNSTTRDTSKQLPVIAHAKAVPTDAEENTEKPAPVYAKKPSKRRFGFIFVLGGLFGICIALFFANKQDVIRLDSWMDINIDSLMDVIPQGILKDAKEFSVRLYFLLSTMTS